MNPFRSNIGTLNEILFEKKNKMYGAYAIRAAYGSTVFKSLGITASIMLGGVWSLAILLGREVEVRVPVTDDIKPLVTYTVDLRPEQMEKPKIDQPKSAAAALKNNTTITQVIIKDKPLTDSVKLAVNDPNNIVAIPTPGTGTSTATSTGTSTVAITNTLTTYEPVKFPEVFPSFPDLKKFWATNLRYPAEAREHDIEGKVAINFVVDEEGNVVNCKILKGLGYGCDEEVLRVMKLMPKWKPGTMSGRAVKVSLSQAIDFKLQ